MANERNLIVVTMNYRTNSRYSNFRLKFLISQLQFLVSLALQKSTRRRTTQDSGTNAKLLTGFKKTLSNLEEILRKS
jgi:hypothetical protein